MAAPEKEVEDHVKYCPICRAMASGDHPRNQKSVGR